MSRNCNYSGINRGPRIPPLSDNLKKIYRVLSKSIVSWGFDVYVTDSVRTRSRYMTIKTGHGVVKIRLSDHPPGRFCNVDYDVYTGKPRRKALDYKELMAMLEKRLKENEKPWADKKKINIDEAGVISG